MGETGDKWTHAVQPVSFEGRPLHRVELCHRRLKHVCCQFLPVTNKAASAERPRRPFLPLTIALKFSFWRSWGTVSRSGRSLFPFPPAVDESLSFPFSPRENQFATSCPVLPPAFFFRVIVGKTWSCGYRDPGWELALWHFLGLCFVFQPDCGAVEGCRAGSLVRLCGTVCPSPS